MNDTGHVARARNGDGTDNGRVHTDEGPKRKLTDTGEVRSLATTTPTKIANLRKKCVNRKHRTFNIKLFFQCDNATTEKIANLSTDEITPMYTTTDINAISLSTKCSPGKSANLRDNGNRKKEQI